MCNIPIYFCNTDIKHLQHTPEAFETLEIDASTCSFIANISLLLGRMDPRRRVEFYLRRHGLHTGEFRHGHDELGWRARGLPGRR
jgi:hypothetical protein